MSNIIQMPPLPLHAEYRSPWNTLPDPFTDLVIIQMTALEKTLAQLHTDCVYLMYNEYTMQPTVHGSAPWHTTQNLIDMLRCRARNLEKQLLRAKALEQQKQP